MKMHVSRRAFLALTPVALLACTSEAQAAELIEVAKSPTCGCCTAWIDRLRWAGFQVEIRDMDDVTPFARNLGVPDNLRSCHTGSIGGYAIEGHVPVADIRRLLAERPDAAGIAVPGMPHGSPGMEVNNEREPYDVILFTRDGRRSAFARYEGNVEPGNVSHDH
jgi:hypothetical protein